MDAGAPSAVGAIAELAVATGLRKAGYDVYTPFFCAHSRVDLIACGDAGPLRLQVKSARLGRGFVYFSACSNTGGQRIGYRGQVDAFGVYSPHHNSVYLVPVDHVPLTQCRLRLAPAKNNQALGVHWAADYLIGPP
jgi:hypothetical protein